MDGLLLTGSRKSGTQTAFGCELGADVTKLVLCSAVVICCARLTLSSLVLGSGQGLTADVVVELKSCLGALGREALPRMRV